MAVGKRRLQHCTLHTAIMQQYSRTVGGKRKKKLRPTLNTLANCSITVIPDGKRRTLTLQLQHYRRAVAGTDEEMQGNSGSDWPVNSKVWAKQAVSSRGGRGHGVPKRRSTMLSSSLLATSILWYTCQDNHHQVPLINWTLYYHPWVRVLSQIFTPNHDNCRWDLIWLITKDTRLIEQRQNFACMVIDSRLFYIPVDMPQDCHSCIKEFERNRMKQFVRAEQNRWGETSNLPEGDREKTTQGRPRSLPAQAAGDESTAVHQAPLALQQIQVLR